MRKGEGPHLPVARFLITTYIESIGYNRVRFVELGISKLAINIYKAHSQIDKSPKSQLSDVHDLLSELVVMQVL